MKFIILDRDGVINYDSDEYIKSAQEWQAIPGSIEAIARLKQAGYKVAVATNQSGLARGLFSKQDLAAMHAKMNGLLALQHAVIDYLALCPHGPDDNCNCRKPKIGLLLEISQALNLPLEEAYFVGDSKKDIQAAQKAGCTPILVRSGKGERTLQQHPELLHQVKIYDDLAQFTENLLGKPNE